MNVRIKGRRNNAAALICSSLVITISLFVALSGAAYCQEASAYPDLAARMKGEVATIEELTGGKAKIGDTIDKNNMDLVKEYLSPGMIECLNQGMVIRLGVNPKPTELVPSFFIAATEKNSTGVKMADEYGTIYMADGSKWKGGVPYPEPKDGLEAATNIKHGMVVDDLEQHGRLFYISKDGSVEKEYVNNTYLMRLNARMVVDPTPAVRGYEKELRRKIMGFEHPIEMAGVGQLSIRHYDEVATPDTGFSYVPAFKRTIRQSATTWQENVGGSDYLWCDSEGIADPFDYWKFKLLGKKYMLLPALKQEASIFHESFDKTGKLNEAVKFTVGRKFPEMNFAIVPTWVVEITPRIEHVYSKKILYVAAYPYWQIYFQAGLTECYDPAGELWKCIVESGSDIKVIDGEPYTIPWGPCVHDLQSGHTTLALLRSIVQQGLTVDRHCTLKTLVQFGR
ncbi:MAG TPA: DUF1329 domain-containing protein [Thermodesulfobacteriota bacterium]|nr:DUF1329 domain-containing protein [Thermodesulfobacteriota bacterium]